MSEKIAQFRFQGYRVTESSIKIASANPPSQQLDVNFNQTIGVDDGEHKMHLQLDTSIKDKDGLVDIIVKAEGYFDFDQDLTQEQKDIFFKTSAPAILFPYIRAYISTLSALSGISPITLPTLNLSQR